MFGFFSSNKRKETGFVFDIGSASVGGALVALEEGKQPKILYSVRENMAFQEDLKFDRFLSSMLTALEKTAHLLADNIPKENHPRFFFCSLASPWYASQTRIAHLKEDKEFIVTERLLNDILKKEIASFEEFEAPKLGKDITIIESRNMQVKLNGYETATPVGKEAKDLQAAFHISIAPKKIISLIEKKLTAVFHEKSFSFHSFPFLAFLSARDFFHERDFIFLDISGELTDVVFIRDNILQSVVSFPYGKNFILRRLMDTFRVTEAECSTYLRMYRENKLDEKIKIKMDKTFSEIKKQWLSHLDKAAKLEASEGTFATTQIFFMADDDVSWWFEQVLKDGAIAAGNIDSGVNVRALGSAFFTSICSFKDGITRDPFLSLEALSVGRFTS